VLRPVELDDAEAAERLAGLDGLVLVGGGDIDPARYGEERRPEVASVSAARDAFELPVARAAIALGMPTLAICRGLQVLNVALGGSLEQHIGGRDGLLAHRAADGKDGVTHDVRILPGSRLAEAMGVERARCFSYHHQALARLAPGLRPVAWSDDGLVEAAELDDDGWVVGIQWHPETTTAGDPAQQGLFDALSLRAVERAVRGVVTRP
jgi:putative glutamine amidotransferase